MRRTLVLVAALVALAGAAAPALLLPQSAEAEAPVQAPTVPDRFVLRPSFTTTLGPIDAGSAFALTYRDQTVLVTALHLLGPAGGLKAQVEAGKVGEVVQSMAVRGAFVGGATIATAKTVIPVAGAHPMGDDAAGDILILKPEVKTGIDRLEVRESPKLTPGTLAPAAPVAGDPVWLVAKVPNSEARAHKAKVGMIDDKWLFYELDQADLKLDGANGAPVVNAAGQIVGIQLGGGTMDDGKLVGAANPWSAVRKALDGALAGG